MNALSHNWVGVPRSKYGEQVWDQQSIQINEDGTRRVLSKFIPNTKSEITKVYRISLVISLLVLGINLLKTLRVPSSLIWILC